MEAAGLVKAKTGVLAGVGPSLWSLLLDVADDEALKAGREVLGSIFLVVKAVAWPDISTSNSMRETKVRMTTTILQWN